MQIRRISWIAFCTCGAILLLFQCMEPVVSSDPAFEFILFSGAFAMFLGATSGAYLLLGYLIRWASKG